MARIARPRIAPPRTWEDAATRFIDHHRTRRRSELTLRWYRADLDLFAAWYRESRGEAPSLAAIDAEALLDFQDHLKGRGVGPGKPAGKGKARPGPRPATINRRLSAVKSLISWGVRVGFRGAILDPPPNLAMPPRVVKSLDPARQRKLLKEMERRNDHRAREVALILLHTGMRVNELCSLTWSAVDLRRGGASVTIAGKGGKVRSVELSGEGRAAFLAIRKRTEAAHGPDHVGPLDPVLVSARRHPERGPVRLGTQGVQKMLARYSAAVGLEKLTPHMLRHSFATNHTLAGDPLPMVQAWLGHSRLETTAIYTQVGPAERRKAMDRFSLPDPDADED